MSASSRGGRGVKKTLSFHGFTAEEIAEALASFDPRVAVEVVALVTQKLSLRAGQGIEDAVAGFDAKEIATDFLFGGLQRMAGRGKKGR